MLDLFLFVLDLLLDGPRGLIFLSVISAFDSQLSIFEIVSLLVELEGDSHVVAVVV